MMHCRRARILAKLHSKHGAPNDVGATAAAAMPDGTSNQNRARTRATAIAEHSEKIEAYFLEEVEREKAARSALMGELSERTEPAKFSKYLSKLHVRDANDGVVLVSKIRQQYLTPPPGDSPHLPPPRALPATCVWL